MRKSFHSEQYRRFVSVMAEARAESGLTQQALADSLGRPQSFVAKFEAGERRLDIVEFITIARALKADPVKLLRRLLR